MKDIKNYRAKKYDEYKMVKDDIYEVEKNGEKIYVTSLSFVQEKEYGEGECAAIVSQYPLEDILDAYSCYISDFYKKMNTKESKVCYFEFASRKEINIENLRKIIGKHVYNKEVNEDERPIIKLVIE